MSSLSPTLSIVVPAHNEEENLFALHRGLAAALAADPSVTAGGSPIGWELVVVDDGSRDGTWAAINELAIVDPRVRGVKLSRNFGHQNALVAGLRAARGAAVCAMDADLQHPPEIVPTLVAKWRCGAKVVYTVRTDAGDTPLFKRWTSWLFYRLLSFLCDERIESGVADFWLLDRSVAEPVAEMGARDLFFRGLIQWVGFPRARVDYVAASRRAGRTKYSFARMCNLALLGVTSMTVRPLRLGIVAGLGAAMLAVSELFYVLYVALVAGNAVPGWASILVIVSVMFSFLFVYLGVLGEYVGKTFEHVKGRPTYLVEETTSGPVDVSSTGDSRAQADVRLEQEKACEHS